jgi:glutathione S-transferase
MSVHWMMIELGIAFEARAIDFTKDAQHDPDYLRLNPEGRVPTLIVDGVPHHESAALLMLLAEQHRAAGLSPEPGSPDRGAWLELMIFLANTLLPAMRDWFYADKDGEPEGAAAVRALAQRRIEHGWDYLDARLADGRACLVGETPGTADFLAVVLMRWSRNMPRPATGWPRLGAYVAGLTALPSFIELNAREGLSGWPPVTR